MATPKVGAIVIDCNDLDTMVAFWGELLDLEVAARYPEFVFMGKVNGDGPSLAFQLVPEEKSVKNRAHLDLAGEDREAIVARVIELGGTRLADHEIEGFYWTTCADTQGNEFDVADADEG
ncbi:MAG: VOC family protein [Acidimicrobiia bacterium]|nr:MAG: VOC family protein [Acidimicrobiia bacterium]